MFKPTSVRCIGGRLAHATLCQSMMNLLLLLSALLSAFTGVGAGTRGIEPAAAVQGPRAFAVSSPRAVAITRRPAATLPTFADTALGPMVLATPPRRSVPLFLSRRRE